jgi:hypothetical protein
MTIHGEELITGIVAAAASGFRKIDLHGSVSDPILDTMTFC